MWGEAELGLTHSEVLAGIKIRTQELVGRWQLPLSMFAAEKGGEQIRAGDSRTEWPRQRGAAVISEQVVKSLLEEHSIVCTEKVWMIGQKRIT